MALTATFDYPTLAVQEPGFRRRVTTEDLAEQGDPTDREVWAEPCLNTIMLKPKQLDPSWIDTSQQLDSIIRLADLAVNSGDTLNRRIYEHAYGNNAGPWIHHNAAYPAAHFIDGPAPTLSGITVAHEIPDIDVSAGGSLTTVHPHDVYAPLTSLPTAGSPPAPVRIGGYEDRKTVAETAQRLEANQAVFLRWFQPEDLTGNRTFYVFYVGQFAIHVRDVVVEVWEDISPHGDRSAGRKVLTYPLWGNVSEAEARRSFAINPTIPWNLKSHDRFLLWLPYRRNKVLLLSNLGKCCLLTTRPDNQIKRNADNNDWVNVRADTVRVSVLSPVFGRFQIQKVKYGGPSVLNGPIAVMDYQPAAGPSLNLQYDADRASLLSAVHSSPPSYTLTPKRKDDCPDPGNPPNWLVSRHGVQLTLTASPDNRRTPFFYSYGLIGTPVFVAPATTPLAVPDAASGTRLLSLDFSLGLKPGEGRGTAEIFDFRDPMTTLYPLGNHYYRSEVPIQFADGATVYLQGVTDEIEVTPLKDLNTLPRRVTVPIVDNWRLLTHTLFQDKIDWGGTGHITAVLAIAKMAGIDDTAAETPPINTPALNRRWNQALGGEPTVNQFGGAITPPWETKPADTAAKFIQRIAEHFSGWDVGFRADGKLFYLPKEYFTAVGTRFYSTAAAATAAGHTGAPLYRGPVTFATEHPEALVIVAVSGSEKDGTRQFSPVFVDWAAIKNPAAANYMGQWRAEVIELAGGYTCPELTWVARTVWNETRKRHRTVVFDADYLDTIKIGHIVELNPYGNYRITGVSARFEKRNWHNATYRGVFQERGY